MIPVEDNPNLVRDPNSSFVVSNDYDEYLAFMARRSASLSDKDRINIIEQKIKDQDEKLDLILKLLLKE